MSDIIKAVIRHPKASDVIYGDKNYLTNKEIDIDFSVALRLGRLFAIDLKSSIQKEYNPLHWKDNFSFGLTGDADTKSGFGNCTVNLIKYSAKNGYDVRWVGFANGTPELSGFRSASIPRDIGMVWHEQPKASWLDSPFKKNIALVPFETTRIPPSWVNQINSFDAVLVPCAHNVQMMKDSGITVPIELIHWGIDSERFYPLKRDESDIFTFGTMGALSIRKGTELLVEAFTRAFPERQYKNVRLICKTSSTVYPFMKKDPRITVKLTAVEHDELINEFFKLIDVFVLPTRGEGAGLPILEALATGIPAIATGWSGPLDYMTKDCGWFLDYKLVPAKEFTEKVYKEYCGLWAEPNIDDLVERMRYCYENRDEVKKKGQYAAKWVRENLTWGHSIWTFINALNNHL